MALTLAISSISILGMIVLVVLSGTKALEKVHFPLYVLPLLVGAAVLLLLGQASLETVKNAFLDPSSVNPLKTLLLFLSMAFLSLCLDETGFFAFLAAKAASKKHRSQFPLFLTLYGLIAVLTVFTSNDVIILTFTPFLCLYCKNAKVSPIPYLVSMFSAANTWSMMLLFGNPTNIYLANYAGIDFLSYVKVMGVPTLFAGLLSLGFLCLLFGKRLFEPSSAKAVDVPRIADRFSLIACLVALSGCTVLLALSHYIGLDMAYVAFGAAFLLLIVEMIHGIFAHPSLSRLAKAAKRLPYAVIPLLLSMFVIVLALRQCGFSSTVGSWLSSINPVLGYGVSSALLCNVMNNIPMSVLFAGVAEGSLPAIYATIAGSNLGALFTPIGALAGIMFCSLCKKQDVKFSYLDFLKYEAPLGVIALAGMISGLLLFL